VRRSVLWYLLNGGRHIDTAQLYLNHKAIGRAIEQAIARGVPRAEMWVTTKLHERFYDRGQDAILKMVKEWMEELRVDYLDLVLLHQPKPLLVLGHTCKDWTQCARSAWRALAEAKNKGWAKNIGVSNFNIEQLKDLQALDVGSMVAANQFMLNPWSPSWAFEIADYCQQHKIAVTVWAPLAGTTMQTKKAMSDPMIRNITANHSGSSGKRPSSAQVCHPAPSTQTRGRARCPLHHTSHAHPTKGRGILFRLASTLYAYCEPGPGADRRFPHEI
jgi:diketogulonate reductase-like aldo/keto reductase